VSSFLGFVSATGIVPDGREHPLVDWTHQPFYRGAAPKPEVEDSAIVTVQFCPRFLKDFDGAEAGLGYGDLFAIAKWSAAGRAELIAEFDLVQGTSASFVATAVKASVFYALSPATPAPDIFAPGISAVTVDATIGRGARAVSLLSDLIRTITIPTLAVAAVSAATKIKPFARAIYLTSRNNPPAAFTATVIQRSGSPTGPIVQADAVLGTQPLQFVPVNHRATHVEVTNTSAVAQNFNLVFRIVLP
jgi:hypothetical protein